MLDEIDKLGARLPRRPGGGAARGARPRAEQHLLRSLPRGAVRPVEGHVHRDREPARPDPAGAARPHGDPRAPRLHARGEAADRAAVTWCRSSSTSTGSTTEQLEIADDGARRDHRQLHARGRRAQPRARDRRASCRARRGEGRRGRGRRARASTPTSDRASILGPAEVLLARSPSAPRSRAWRPASPGRRSGGDILFIEATQDARQGQADAHRPARRRDEGVGAGGAVVRARAAPSGSGIERELPREDRHPRPRPGGRDPEGRPVGGRHHVHRAGRRCSPASRSATTSR